MSDSIVDIFNKFKIINCLCPKCNLISRVSDLNLYSGTKSEKIWLDIFEEKMFKLEEKKDDFLSKEKELKEKSIQEGRKQIKDIINNQLRDNFRNLNYDPYDIKPILHPIDFIVFNGMNAGNIKNITLLSNKATTTHIKHFHNEIEHAIEFKLYEWKELRISDDGDIEYK